MKDVFAGYKNLFSFQYFEDIISLSSDLIFIDEKSDTIFVELPFKCIYFSGCFKNFIFGFHQFVYVMPRCGGEEVAFILLRNC